MSEASGINAPHPVDAGADVEVLGLHVRIMNCLASIGVTRVDGLCQCRASDLLKLPGFSTRSLYQVRVALQRAGLTLRAEDA